MKPYLGEWSSQCFNSALMSSGMIIQVSQGHWRPSNCERHVWLPDLPQPTNILGLLSKNTWNPQNAIWDATQNFPNFVAPKIKSPWKYPDIPWKTDGWKIFLTISTIKKHLIPLHGETGNMSIFCRGDFHRVSTGCPTGSFRSRRFSCLVFARSEMAGKSAVPDDERPGNRQPHPDDAKRPGSPAENGSDWESMTFFPNYINYQSNGAIRQ